jgi:hypothetical protein
MSDLLKRTGRTGVASIVLLWATMSAVAMTRPAYAEHHRNELEMKARESFAAGRYDEALEAFAKLYAETLHPAYLRNIGRCRQKMREPQQAIDAFQDYLAKTKSGKDKISLDERAEIEGYIAEMEALRVEQEHTAAPAPIAPVTPPPRAPPAAPPPTSHQPAVTLARTAPPPRDAADHPLYTRWWLWGIVGVVAAGAVVGVAIATGGTTRPSCPTGVVCE